MKAITGKQVVALLKKNPVSVSCAVLSLALGAGIYFRGDGMPVAEEQLNKLSDEGGRLATNIKYSAQLNEQLATLLEAEKAIDTRVVRASELAKNLQYFYKLESDTGTKISDLHQDSVVPKKGAKDNFTSIGFGFTVEGEYPALLDFLRRLEHGAHFCRIVTANVGVSSDLERPKPLKLNLTLELLGQP
ncbi:MAG TPA: hypothetical protein VHE13_18245 [Opitutus sp.]|nr:hypothetical protein [Opitutus sp.]